MINSCLAMLCLRSTGQPSSWTGPYFPTRCRASWDTPAQTRNLPIDGLMGPRWTGSVTPRRRRKPGDA